MREKGLSKIQPTEEAEEEWRAHVEEVGKMVSTHGHKKVTFETSLTLYLYVLQGLFAETESWYFGDNIPGKPKEALNYMGGMQAYKQRLRESEDNDYKGFEYQ